MSTVWVIDAVNWMHTVFYRSPSPDDSHKPLDAQLMRFRRLLDVICGHWQARQVFVAFDGDQACAARRCIWPNYRIGDANSLAEEALDMLQLRFTVDREPLPHSAITPLIAPGVESRDWLRWVVDTTDDRVVCVSNSDQCRQLLQASRVVMLRTLREGEEPPGERAVWETANDFERRASISPRMWCDWRILTGWHGYGGCKGIGDRSAARMLTKHGDLRGIYQALSVTQAACTAKQSVALSEYRPRIDEMRRLVTLANPKNCDDA